VQCDNDHDDDDDDDDYEIRNVTKNFMKLFREFFCQIFFFKLT